MDKFIDRTQAGQVLAEHLKEYQHHPSAILLALPRGGVPLAYEIATKLHLPWDIFIVRKLGCPRHEELAMGAIAANGVTVFNEEVLRKFSISKADIDAVTAAETQELKRRETAY